MTTYNCKVVLIVGIVHFHAENAEKCQKCCFSGFLDFGFENFKENDNFLTSTILVLVTVKYILSHNINKFGAMFYSQLFQKLSCGRKQGSVDANRG